MSGPVGEAPSTAPHALADEQAALRRVAEPVARGDEPDEVLVAVTAEAAMLLDVPPASSGRPDRGR